MPVFITTSIVGADLIKEAKEREAQKNAQKKEVVYPAGSQIEHSKSGKVYKVTLSEPFEVQGISWPTDTQITFDEAGKIRRVWIQSAATVQNITWPEDSYLSFTQAGKLSYVWLGHAANIQGKSFAQDDRVRVDSSGQAHKVTGYGGPVTGGASSDY